MIILNDQVLVKGVFNKMRTMAITEFKAHALKVISELVQSREPAVITKRGKPVAQLIPYTEPVQSAGKLAETIVYEGDIISPVDDTWNASH